MTTPRHDPRPGIEEASPARRPLLPRSEVVFGLLTGLVLAVVLVAAIPDARTHMFGGTDRHETTVAAADARPRAGDSDRVVTHYRLEWQDDSGVLRSASFKRSGPPRHEVGDTWELWISPDGKTVEDSSPLTTWLLLGLGLPLFGLLMGVLWHWRQRVFVRMAVRNAERDAQRQQARGRGTA